MARHRFNDKRTRVRHSLQRTLKENGSPPLTELALEVLIAAYLNDAPVELLQRGSEIALGCGRELFLEPVAGAAILPATILQLLSADLILAEGVGYSTSARARSLIDRAIGECARYTAVKVRCSACRLHFALFTTHPHRHNHTTVTCPECGRREGRLLIWSEERLGFIADEVPGES
jgi:ribosomal protein S27E